LRGRPRPVSVSGSRARDSFRPDGVGERAEVRPSAPRSRPPAAGSAIDRRPRTPPR
jgi:hypothetical protein